jgi:hypothetical protein
VVITPCISLKVIRRFGGTHRLHLQGLRSRALLATFFNADFLLGLFDPEDRSDVFPKRRLAFNGLDGVISQKILLFKDAWLPLMYFLWRFPCANVEDILIWNYLSICLQ